MARVIPSNSNFTIDRITAAWALSEAALGGILHALQIPLTGLFINSSAVIFIALIAHYSQNNGSILRATFIVLLVKAGVSPHTPINAFLAVTLQGLLGELIFRWRKYFTISAVVFGVVTLFLSSIQKVIVLTIVFGNTLWDSIDLFGNYVISQFPFINDETINYRVSEWLINIYIFIHITAGLLAGIFASKMPKWLARTPEVEDINQHLIDFTNQAKNQNSKKKRKSWLKKLSGIAFVVLVSAIVILSYIFPKFSAEAGMNAIIMTLRSIFIMVAWYLLVGPFVLKIYRKYLSKKGSTYSSEVNQTIDILPKLKSIVFYSWKLSGKYKNLRRIKYFVICTISNILTVQLNKDE